MFLSAASVTRREFVGDRQEPDGIVGPFIVEGKMTGK